MFPFRAAGGTWTHTLLNFGLPPQGSESAKFLHGRISLSYPFRSPLMSVIQRLECLPSMLRVGFTPTTLRFYYWTTAAFETVFLSVQHVNERYCSFTLLIYKNYAKQANLCIKFLSGWLDSNQRGKCGALWEPSDTSFGHIRFLAGVLRFEQRPRLLESRMLPLQHTPIYGKLFFVGFLGWFFKSNLLSVSLVFYLSSCHFICYCCW